MSFEIKTRMLNTVHDLTLVQKLEEEVWKMQPLPLHQTITASQNGGLLLGAFINEDLVGFSYSFAGFNNGKSYLCSHMLGVHPSHQMKGIGAILKEKQKELAREMGYELIMWTYDPLETRNAYLNLSKLHAISSTYVDNCYGDMEDNLNKGIPSDRLKVEWWTNSPYISKPYPINQEQAELIFKWETIEGKLPKLKNIEEDLPSISSSDNPILLPVPANFQYVKNTNKELAMDWRFKTRKIFHTLFYKGYAVVSLIKNNNQSVHFYVFVPKRSLQNLLHDKGVTTE
ncbi:Predicted acetyltransferase, GNAT superfamily [Bacillus sp. OV166]|uniref:GNAT family N-acetyltransferase n=1 Tax=Bacillus sp. OV166 TaxID=1882763 RepID=UPI000A2AB19D|nr:GNAT family N-acetyltransferase [Bacillus sp. OV166]SMQ81436.1 Predicted acetyltransferase, GNAT superfamily [Bacillus sp. OV166]